MPSHTELGEFIWRIADHLRGDYEKNDNEDVILPFTLLRRLDCVLEKARDKVRETEAQIAGKVTDDVLKKGSRWRGGRAVLQSLKVFIHRIAERPREH
jgi:type I restriction enzyme M protein